MKRLSLLFVLAAAMAFSMFAQDEPSTAPVVWERYSIADQKLSFSLPKMPVLIANSSNCTEVDRRSYYAYADGIVYEVTIAAKRKQFVVSGCRSIERFTPELIKARLNELRTAGGVEVLPTIDERASQKVYKYNRGGTQQWVYDDAGNARWVEMIAHYWNDQNGDSDKFFDSVQFASTEGKDIGEGSGRTIGDTEIKDDIRKAGAKSKVDPTDPTKIIATSDPLVIVAKPRARYTDEARNANLQGTVALRVTLLANGGIGSIVVVKELPYGLTEQAIAAAKKVVFLPKRVNGYPMSVSKTIEYNFNIY
jgi:TonB family protein